MEMITQNVKDEGRELCQLEEFDFFNFLCFFFCFGKIPKDR